MNEEVYNALGWTPTTADNYVELKLSPVSDLGYFELESSKALNTQILSLLLPKNVTLGRVLNEDDPSQKVAQSQYKIAPIISVTWSNRMTDMQEVESISIGL